MKSSRIARPQRRFRIAMDASSILKERTGVGIYTYNLVLHLAPRVQNQELIVWANGVRGSMPDKMDSRTLRARLRRTRIPGKLLLSYWRHFSYPTVETLLGKIDLFHSTNFFFHPHRRDTKTVATIHDLFFLTHPEMAERYGGGYFKEVLRKFSAGIDHFIAVSDWTKKDLMKHLDIPPERISVIHHGIDPLFLGPPGMDSAALLSRYGIDRPYFLSVGTIEPRKNYDFLIESFDSWRRQSNEDCLLVIAGGPGWGCENVYRRIEELRADEWVRMIGYVGQETLHSLYRNCRAVLLTTLYEGFCLPALEAMACGAPVVASDTSALREVLGDTGLFFPLNNREAFLGSMDAVFDQREDVATRVHSARERAKRFSWDKAADLTRQVYERVLEEAIVEHSD
jgi:glycosyltransferase involved in cell wall biosynthesis